MCKILKSTGEKKKEIPDSHVPEGFIKVPLFFRKDGKAFGGKKDHLILHEKKGTLII